MSERDPSSAGTAGTATVLDAHVAECEDCRATPPPIDRIAAILNTSIVAVDATALSCRTLARLQPELARRAGTGLWRKAAAALLLALVPLPIVLAYDAYVLRVAYELASALLPAAVAAFLIFGYAAFLALLFATTYATIPLFLAHRTNAGQPVLGPQGLV
jgi:hypothetical protein